MLRQALLSSTQPVDRFCTGNYAGYEGMMGIGRLDAYKLLLTIAKMDGIPAQKVAAGATVSLDLRDYFLSANILGYTGLRPRRDRSLAPRRRDADQGPPERRGYGHRFGRRRYP